MSSARILKTLFWVGVIVGIDYGSKIWILATPSLPWVVTSFLNLVSVKNKGISFGLFPAGSHNHVLFLAALAGAIAMGVFVWSLRAREPLLRVGLISILGGACGNLVDRFLWGGVIDFLDFHLLSVHFPAFNIADACITCGTGLVLWSQIMEKSLKVR